MTNIIQGEGGFYADGLWIPTRPYLYTVFFDDGTEDEQLPNIEVPQVPVVGDVIDVWEDFGLKSTQSLKKLGQYEVIKRVWEMEIQHSDQREDLTRPRMKQITLVVKRIEETPK